MPTNDQIILKQLLEDRKTNLAANVAEAFYFDIFSAEQVLKDYEPSYDDLEEGIIDGGGDGGIDSIYIVINGELIHPDTDLVKFQGDVAVDLIIIQSKKTDGFSEDAIHRFDASALCLLDLSQNLNSLSPLYNSGLLTIIEKFRDVLTKFASRLPKLSIHYYYTSTGEVPHPNVELQVAKLKQTIRTLHSSAEFSFDFVGAGKLLGLARTAPTTTYPLKLAESPLQLTDGIICLATLVDYRDFLSDDHGKYRRGIFDSNVRDYQGDIEVNKAIRDTLTNPRDEDFWWLNNGITILAEAAPVTGKTVNIKDPRVVNGLQTSQEIFQTFQADPSVAREDRRVLIRIILPKAEGSYDRIVRATNSQTTVPPASLRATDPIHRDIEDHLKHHDYYYERRKNLYKNEGRPKERIVSIAYMAQAAMAIILGRPNDARARPSTLIKFDDEYSTVFDPTYPIGVYLNCILLMKSIESYLRNKGLSSQNTNNLKYYMAMYVSRRVLNQLKPKPLRLQQLDLALITDDFRDTCYGQVDSIYQSLGANDQVAKGADFVAEVNKNLQQAIYSTTLSP